MEARRRRRGGGGAEAEVSGEEEEARRNGPLPTCTTGWGAIKADPSQRYILFHFNYECGDGSDPCKVTKPIFQAFRATDSGGGELN